MDLASFQLNVKKNSLKDFYIFTGLDIGIMNEYVKKIADLKKLKIKRILDFETIKQSLKMRSLLSDNYLYVIYNDTSLANVDRIEIKSGDMVIARFDKVDNHKKLFITYSDEIIHFTNMHENVLLAYCQKYFKKSSGQFQKYLIKFCNKDFERLMSEIDKIDNLSDVLGITKDEALKKMLSEEGVYKIPENTLFRLVHSLMIKSFSAFELLQEAYEHGEYVLAIIKNLSVAVISLLAFKGCSNEIEKNTGLQYYQIKNCQQWNEFWKPRHLLKILSMIRYVEIGIKTGKLEDKQAMNFLILEMLL